MHIDCWLDISKPILTQPRRTKARLERASSFLEIMK
nr:MAG TPA: hypothetical protein [Caudoviricetes sp.]